jgi:hypothetical protein
LSDLVPDIMAKLPNRAGTVERMLPPGAVTEKEMRNLRWPVLRRLTGGLHQQVVSWTILRERASKAAKWIRKLEVRALRRFSNKGRFQVLHSQTEGS